MRQHGEAGGGVCVVVHDENAATRDGGKALDAVGRLHLGGGGGGRRDRLADDEFASPAVPFAVRLDDPPVHFHEAFDDGQADTKASVRPSRDRSTCANMSKITSSIVEGMPIPLSLIETET